MKISFDPEKRAKTLAERGLDFEDAAIVFAGLHFDAEDDRFDYGEVRIVTSGLLAQRVVVLVWTQRDDGRRIISMRKADENEQKTYFARVGRS